jgi:uncharacterized protein (DUF697 family)/GTP-binding protein EngB required for normal cell division
MEEMKGNILVLGNSGVGKSTLINAVLGEEIAAAGIGTEGTTKELAIYEPADLDIRLIDSVGFEPSLMKRISAVKSVDKWCKSVKDNEAERKIDVIWFCVDGSASKLFDSTFSALFSATSMWKSVPIIVAITKSHSDKKHDEENIEMVKRAFHGKKREKNLCGIIPVNSAPYPVETEENEQPVIVGVKGIQELLDLTISILPKGKELAQKDLDNFKLKQKRNFAQGTIAVFTGTAATIGAVPIPFADGALLAPLEVAEIKAIGKIYGIQNDDKTKDLLNRIVEVGTVGVAAKGVISALKAIPGINLAAGVMNAIIAGAFVAGIGEAAVYIFEQIYLGKRKITDIDWATKIIESKLKDGLFEKIKNELLKKSGENKN